MSASRAVLREAYQEKFLREKLDAFAGVPAGKGMTNEELERIEAELSIARETTKGGHADLIPIAPALTPYLQTAIDASPSDLVFPWLDALAGV